MDVGRVMAHSPIAYTYEADVHCPDCAEERFGRSERGFVGEDCEDSEGNEVGIIAPWDEWQSFEDDGPEVLACGDCHEIIEVCPPASTWTDRVKDAYLECALWADWPTDDHGVKVDAELSDELADGLAQDVVDFLEVKSDETLTLLVGMDAAQVGHDLWLTRNRHGAGFWDRGLGKRGDRLTEIAHGYGGRYLYVGDDGQVYVQ